MKNEINVIYTTEPSEYEKIKTLYYDPKINKTFNGCSIQVFSPKSEKKKKKLPYICQSKRANSSCFAQSKRSASYNPYCKRHTCL